MAWRRLRRQCLATLAGFEIPSPFSVEAVCAQVSQRRDRKLHLHPMPFAASPGLPCGVWIALPGGDHVFYAKGASAMHQQNIILHELGHVICDHRMDAGDSDLAALFTDLDPTMVRRVLARTRYSTPQEEEAEMMAALILAKAGWTPLDLPPTKTLGHLSAAFGLSHPHQP
jgi:hypothetical protein